MLKHKTMLYFSTVREFLEAATSKMLKLFPLTDPVLRIAPILLPKNRDQFTLTDVVEAARKFPVLKLDATQLELEWLDYLVMDVEARFEKNPELFWGHKSEDVLPLLTKLMRCLMALPHSNASSERMFSMLKKIHTEQRPSLSHAVITSLMSVKVNLDTCCYNTKFDAKALKSIKKAAMAYNESYQSGASSVVDADITEVSA